MFFCDVSALIGGKWDKNTCMGLFNFKEAVAVS